MAVLILVAWVLAVLALIPVLPSRREAALFAFAGVSAVVLVDALGLSVLRAYTWQSVALSWLLVIALLVVLERRQMAAGWSELAGTRVEMQFADWLVAAILGVFGAATLAGALLYPVINFDSLTYHLPRVFFWIENHSVAPYATPEGRQLFSSAFAEYFVLNVKVLSLGSDRLVNLVQWLSYVFSIATVSLIARALGVRRRGQQVAAVLGAATPMAILQASTTQNDLTCALWVLAFAFAVVSYVARRHESTEPRGPALLILAAASVVLATQTKPPAYIMLAPFVLWGAWVALRRESWRRIGIGALAILIPILVFDGSWYVQNLRLGVDLLGTNAPGNEHVLIKDRRPASVAETMIENSSMLLGTPSSRVNGVISDGLRRVIRAIGANPDNPLTREADAGPYVLDDHVLDHDVGPSPIVFLLVLVCAIFVLVRPGEPAAVRRIYAAAALIALFGTAAVINWNHFINRILLGGLLLLVPLAGVVCQALRDAGHQRGRWALTAALVLAVAWGLAVVSFDSTNRLIPPRWIPFKTADRDLGFWNTSYEELKFVALPEDQQLAYREIASAARRNGVHNLQIDQIPLNVAVYPLLEALPAGTHVFYGPPTVLPGRLPREATPPDAVLEIGPAGGGKSGAKAIWGPRDAAGYSFALVRR
jgi:hypothetical protein